MKTKIITLAFLLIANSAAIAEQMPRTGLVNLSATASTEVKNDKMTVVLFIESRGSDAKKVAAINTTAINKGTSIAEQKSAVTVTTGNRRMMPLYQINDKKGLAEGTASIIGWSERAELILTSKDFSALSEVVSKLSGTLHTESMSFSVDDETRDKAESVLLEKALTEFRNKAWDVSKMLGKGGYKIVEVSIQSSGHNPIRPMAMMLSRGANEPAELNGGVTSINQVVSGQIVIE